MDLRTLQFWHKLEHFYPYILQEQRSPYIQTFRTGGPKIFPDFEAPLVCEDREVRGYCVYLGIFQVAPALAALEEGIGKKMRFRDCGKDESCFCMFRLSPDGTAQPESFQISSFPWAIHRVRAGKICLDHWDEDFFCFQKEAISYLETRKTPVDYDFLQEFRDMLASQMNWTVAYCRDWLRIDMMTGRTLKDGSSATPGADPAGEEIQAENEATDEQMKKNDLLNSFYIRDLERVIDGISQNEAACSAPLRQFLAPEAGARIDIEKDSDAMFRLMSPKYLPMGRWPSDYGARWMQQVNVNAFLSQDPAFAQPLFSVNGPPGTGKTTLLKDVIAAIVTERANLLSTLEAPDQAFQDEEIGCIQVGTYRNRIWKLKAPFSDFGILVASNNNGAVENITLGLPGLTDLPERYRGAEYRYFSEVSDQLLGKDKTWALHAAALGNKRNRLRFAEAFWPLDREQTPYNFRLELLQQNRRFQMETWQEAKRFYAEKRGAVEQEFARMETVYRDAGELRNLNMEIPKLQAQITALEVSLQAAREALSHAEQADEQMQEKHAALSAQMDGIRRSKPFFKIRLLLRRSDPALKEYQALSAQREQLSCEAATLQEAVRSARRHVESLQKDLREKKIAQQEGQRRRAQLSGALEDFRQETGMPLRMDTYFEDCGAGERSKSSPWGYRRLNELREQLFLAALRLHQTFVIGSCRMRDNLDGFGKMLRGSATEAQASMFFSPLLQSFFLLVPVVSTTFASVGSFLRHISSSEIAYLFIDEAGQAVPQSAVGAIWRARKVIAVGDPLQIEPVVTLHDSVIHALANYYAQGPLLTDPYTSVQTLGDRANRIGGWRSLSQPNDLWIGAPLTVHSRCQRTVFQIANRIAYNDKMIFATKERPDAVCRWIDVHGASEWEHYVPAQAKPAAEIVLDAFTQFAGQGNGEKKYPSLFLITPFRSVKAGLVQYFRQNLCTMLTDAGLQIESKCVKAWIGDCIGTVHTFQGKEADTVILCLGVDSGGQGAGAVEWAGERPNILNVAVTRSKRNLFILGDQKVWCRKNYFQIARDFCAGGPDSPGSL